MNIHKKIKSTVSKEEWIESMEWLMDEIFQKETTYYLHKMSCFPVNENVNLIQ